MEIETMIHCGDCLEILKTLPPESVNCCVTSPPYFGLRDYGVSGQIGLEQTPDEYVSKLVAVFREVKRVLRDDGTLWLNLGDSYCSTAPGTMGDPLRSDGTFAGVSEMRRLADKKYRPKTPPGLKPKDLIGIPWRVAFALQADGWYLRQGIIWHKPNPMPESVKDRCTKAHEYVFLLSRSARYFYDLDAVKEPLAESTLNDSRNNTGRHTQGKNYSKYFSESSPDSIKIDMPSWYRQKTFVNSESGRNRRSVWTIPTKPYKGAHFATFPPALVEPCILAGCPAGGVVLDPFFGSGTVGAVAVKHGREFVGIELNPEYIALAEKRIRATQPPLLLESQNR